MKTRRWIMLSMVCLLFFVGCTALTGIVADPNSGLNTSVDTVEDITPLIGAGASATGTPWGAGIFAITTALSALIGVYKNYRTKVVAGKKYHNIEVTTKAIVDAVDAIDDTVLATKIKALVSDKLKDKDCYKIGRAVIYGLKAN